MSENKYSYYTPPEYSRLQGDEEAKAIALKANSLMSEAYKLMEDSVTLLRKQYVGKLARKLVKYGWDFGDGKTYIDPIEDESERELVLIVDVAQAPPRAAMYEALAEKPDRKHPTGIIAKYIPLVHDEPWRPKQFTIAESKKMAALINSGHISDSKSLFNLTDPKGQKVSIGSEELFHLEILDQTLQDNIDGLNHERWELVKSFMAKGKGKKKATAEVFGIDGSTISTHGWQKIVSSLSNEELRKFLALSHII